MESNLLKEGERLDELQRNGRRIIQHPGVFCFGMDAVLLAAFAKAGPGERVLDLCTGTGIVPILMESRYPGAHYTGLEIQEASADMAMRSVCCNGREEAITILQGDLRNCTQTLPVGRWDAVTVNPPYMKAPSGRHNDNQRLSIARHEVECTLDDVIHTASKLLKSKGRFYMVHRPLRLVEILERMHYYKLEPKRMQLVYPKIDREPNMVLIEGVRDGGSELRVQPPLIIYNEDGTYTEPVRSIYEGE
ncbi:MAG: tRNA1(Val) (adenine(37)-N6)-methyltransferase [Firmicutes bacterium]|nr:tRNA1(Val) (adenine(37)-N6)-methyltransferase [Bacillota bacterium]